MAHSLGLSLYNLAGRHGPHHPATFTPRPRGPLVWLHAPNTEALASMQELGRHLIEEDGLQVRLTHPGDPAPSDYPRAVDEFLDHWHPDLVVFAEGQLLPVTINALAHRKIPMLMVGARSPTLAREGWYPGLIRTCLQALPQIMVLDDAAARAFRRAGAEPGQIHVAGRLEEPSAALPYVESDRAALAKLMVSRPVWLAADVTLEEMPHVVAAHREALQLAHRLLLILVPRDPATAAMLAEELGTIEGWGVATRRLDQYPDAETEVFIADASEYGVWYRLAPVTFLGGSLEGDGCARSPLEPAALGSAIVYGPKPGPYGAAFGRLGAARAARMVGNGAELAMALSDLLSPDRAARQARAAWTIATEGAEATDHVVQAIRAVMDAP